HRRSRHGAPGPGPAASGQVAEYSGGCGRVSAGHGARPGAPTPAAGTCVRSRSLSASAACRGEPGSGLVPLALVVGGGRWATTLLVHERDPLAVRDVCFFSRAGGRLVGLFLQRPAGPDPVARSGVAAACSRGHFRSQLRDDLLSPGKSPVPRAGHALRTATPSHGAAAQATVRRAFASARPGTGRFGHAAGR